VWTAGAARDDGSNWTTFGNSPARLGAVAAQPGTLLRHFVLPLRGRVTGQVLSAAGAFFAATTSGEVVSFNPDGYVRWRVGVGQLAHSCRQLDGYGVVGTGVIDPASRTLYVADAFGRLHALALATGTERPGWPLRVFGDFRRELVWGALSLAGGSVYVPTAAYCDASSPGGVLRVELGTRQVTRWTAVPLELGGGGGPWGWGGVAYDDARNALFAATSGALRGGSNTGDDFTETAGYGDRLVQLGPDLSVQASSHPEDLPDRQDLDFVGSPVLVDRPGCGALAVAATKNDVVYGWRRDDVSAGPIWKLDLERYDPDVPFLSQLAWHTSLASLYAVTGTALVRIQIRADCSPSVVWSRQLGTRTENGSPTIAGETVWFAVNGKNLLAGYDARSGTRVAEAPLGGTTLQAPTIVGGRLVVGTFTGLIQGFMVAGRGTTGRTTAAARSDRGVAASSWADSRHGWESRASGVFATEDGGRSWRRVYAEPALAIARLSRTTGLIDVGVSPGPCMCTTRKLWTADAGRTWHSTNAVGDAFLGSAGVLYWWQGGALHALAKLPLHAGPRALSSRPAASVSDGVIVGAAAIPDGIVALVTRRVGGQGWDTAPRLLVAHGTSASMVELPATTGRPLADEVDVRWPTIVVTARDYVPDPTRVVAWRSSDGGKTWETG
jgi:hypothetical protein